MFRLVFKTEVDLLVQNPIKYMYLGGLDALVVIPLQDIDSPFCTSAQLDWNKMSDTLQMTFLNYCQFSNTTGDAPTTFE